MNDNSKEFEAKLTSYDESEKAPSSERFNIFSALMDAINEKEQKKSRRKSLLERLGFSKQQEIVVDTEPEYQEPECPDESECQDEPESIREHTRSNAEFIEKFDAIWQEGPKVEYRTPDHLK